MEDGAAISRPDQVRLIDAGGRTLLPGLIDAHVHAAITTMDLAAMARRSPTRIGIEAKVVLERMLRRGFTTVRDAGELDAGVRRRCGSVSSPDRGCSDPGGCSPRPAGTATSLPASSDPHIGACSISSSSFSHVADGTDAVRRAAREERKGGADQIKVMASGGVATPTDPIDMVPVHRRGDPCRGRRGSRPPDLGIVAPGAYADLLLIDGDPLRDSASWEARASTWTSSSAAGEIVTNRLGP